MPKISRKIVQAVLRGGGKALTRLANSRVGEKLNRLGFDNKNNFHRGRYGSISRLKLGESDKIIRNTTKFLLDKKLITPRQARTVADMAANPYQDSFAENRPNQKSPKTKLVTYNARRDAIRSRKEARNVPYENFSSDEWGEDVSLAPLDDEQLDRIVRLRTRELQSDKRKDLAWKALVQQSKNYRVGRELLSVLGKAGLTGLAGAQLASSIASGKDVKKMANRRNKYFS